MAGLFRDRRIPATFGRSVATVGILKTRLEGKTAGRVGTIIVGKIAAANPTKARGKTAGRAGTTIVGRTIGASRGAAISSKAEETSREAATSSKTAGTSKIIKTAITSKLPKISARPNSKNESRVGCRTSRPKTI